ncbi:unnamed protein product [Rotaria magnacalcarata]|uniref:SHSP domain-containing protein n=2 Tax=Rotaria magnacalcarata TaxID=392030 RepID=A0A815ZSE0_9BILA|nr:unnamed protein product [Rotaria magnacalcarata]CAF1588478.1 unnamed protein product [Rotaria magnacalcarata]CAF1935960.1 unnamed protein product [Rotaria magnacalcarata]CAF1984308.1 unnamed protein product [Rotaria magnacalcarata]CAF2103501.1 unnamed protein product [Rotaria magnacalcarata]
MSLLPWYRYPLWDDPLDPFFMYPIDFFDPWFDIGLFPPFSSATRSFRWIKEQERIRYKSTNVSSNTKSLPPPRRIPPPEKFRVQLDVSGFKPESVKTRIEGAKIIVEAKEEDREARGDFQLRELRKSYDLPGYADANDLVSHVAPNNMLFIEVPITKSETERRLERVKTDSRSLVRFSDQNASALDDAGFLGSSDFQRRIVDKGNNQKQLELTVNMKDYKPEEIKLSVKFNILSVRGEHRYNDGARFERSYFFKTTTLPRGAQVDLIQSTFADDGQLKIEIPIID